MLCLRVRPSQPRQVAFHKSAPLFLQACPEDALNPLYNELRFTFDGLPSNTNLSPSLALQAQTTSNHPVSNVWSQLANISFPHN